MLNDAGHLAFAAWLRTGSGGITENDNRGIWSQAGGPLGLVVRSGTVAPETSGGIFSNVELPLIDALGRVTFAGLLQTDPLNVTLENDTGLWAQRGGGWELIAREGDDAPGVVGARFSAAANNGYRFAWPVANAAGAIAFRGALQVGSGGVNAGNDSAIWSSGRGPLELVAREGEPAPGGAGNFAQFDESRCRPVINRAGQTAFVGALQVGGDIDAANNDVIWAQGANELRVIAREGSQAPGIPTGENFNFSARSPTTLVLNAAGHVAFYAEIQDSSNGGIWAEDLASVLRLIVREGDFWEVAPGDFRKVSRLSFRSDSGNEDGRGSGFNDRGQVAFAAAFTDGTSGVFVSNLATLPEPASAALIAIAAMSTVSWRRSRHAMILARCSEERHSERSEESRSTIDPSLRSVDARKS